MTERTLLLISLLFLTSMGYAQEKDLCFMPDTLPTHELKKMDYMKSGWGMMAGQMYMQLKDGEEVKLGEQLLVDYSDIGLQAFLENPEGGNYYLHFLKQDKKARSLFMIHMENLEEGSIKIRRPDSVNLPQIFELIYTCGFTSKQGQYEEIHHEIWDATAIIRLAKFSSKIYEAASDQTPDGSWVVSEEKLYEVSTIFNGKLLKFMNGSQSAINYEYTYNEDGEEEEVNDDVKVKCEPKEYLLIDGEFVKRKSP